MYQEYWGLNGKPFENIADARGIPRIINNICDLALLFGAQKGAKEINEEIARDAWQSLEGRT